VAVAEEGLTPPPMPKFTLDRRASDNPYFHPDFHGALSAALTYLEQTHGPETVCAYLRRFTRVYYAPLREALRERGLAALEEHFRSIYAREGGEVEIVCTADSLVIRVRAV